MPINPQHGALEMAGDLLARRYPACVFGKPLRKNELPPIFGYHAADPEKLERLLQFLSRNNYVTLHCDDYLEILHGQRPIPPQAAMLTFDDGERSIWSVANPLLRKYQQKAVVFIIPGRIRTNPSGHSYPTIKDVWQGRMTLAELAESEREEPLATWDETAQMHAEGFIDFQSHTNWHSSILDSPEITGFLSAEDLASENVHDLTCYEGDLRGRSYALPQPGAPRYAISPRMSERCAYPENAALRRYLEAQVEQRGGEAFFSEPNWTDALSNEAKNYLAAYPSSARRETEAERDQTIFEDLSSAKQLIESHLPGKAVRHLAFPWGVGSEPAINAARKAGYACCFWGKQGKRLTNYCGDDPFYLTRIGERFDALLLGEGRSSLFAVLADKVMRRLGRPRA